MSKNNLVEIVCVIDRSGSMESIKSDAIGGFNTFLAAQKKVPGDAKLTMALFNHTYRLVYDCEDLQAANPIDETTFNPGGTTALLDAVGRTIDDIGKRLAGMPENERPESVVFTILTDGLENSSKHYTRKRIHEMIKHQREKYAWEFVFLAANQDAFAEAESLGIDRDQAHTFAPDADGIKYAMAVVCEKVSDYRLTASKKQARRAKSGCTA